MLAVALTVALFTFWGAVGCATLALLHSQRNSLQNLLLAPSVGVAVIVLPIFWLSRLGLSVARVGVGLAVVLLMASLAVLAWRRPALPFRRYAPFAAVLGLALLMTGRPMLRFGFEWLSDLNEDMANYVLGAHRLLNHGFFDIPAVEALGTGRDHTLYYWFMDMAGVRPGSQLLLAGVASVTGLAPDRAFMPTILALHLALVSAAAALVGRSRRQRLAAWATCLLLGASALASLGVLAQLIAQVAGLGLLTALTTLVLRPFASLSPLRLIREGILAGLVGAALVVVYPEVLPFFAASLAVYVAVCWMRGELWTPTLAVLLATGASAVLCVPIFIGQTMRFFVYQMDSALGSGGAAQSDVLIALFPYFLVPKGLAALWGFQPISGVIGEPWMSLTIGLGAIAFVAATALAIALAWRGEPCATMAVAMLGAVPLLYWGRAGFTLFKLAMFIQPFLLGVVAAACAGGSRRRWVRLGLLVLLGLFGLYGQTAHVRGSSQGATWSEALAGTRRAVASTAAERLDLDTTNMPLAKLQALQLVGRSSVFRAADVFAGILPRPRPRVGGDDDVLGGYPVVTRVEEAIVLTRAMRGQRTTAGFALLTHDGAVNVFHRRLSAGPVVGRTPCEILLVTTARWTVLNTRRFGDRGGPPLATEPCAGLRNQLIFVDSTLGRQYHYYGPGGRRNIGLHREEPDPYFPGSVMAALGRHLLFEVIGGSPRVRLGLALSASFKGDGENRLPSAVVIGTERWPFPLLGRGSARVFSPPLSPQVIDGLSYVGIDLGVDGQRFPLRRTGLMRLYGHDLPLDPRYTVAFARDVSLVPEDYRALRAPDRLARFPGDLANPDLEYAGIYEDGWVGEEFSVYLGRPIGPSVLELRGLVPLIDDAAFRSECAVRIDEHEIERRTLTVGSFVLRVSPAAVSDRVRIDLRCSRAQRLPASDSRPVVMKLEFVGFQRAAE